MKAQRTNLPILERSSTRPTRAPSEGFVSGEAFSQRLKLLVRAYDLSQTLAIERVSRAV
jgi:hypothetical protein